MVPLMNYSILKFKFVSLIRVSKLVAKQLTLIKWPKLAFMKGIAFLRLGKVAFQTK